MRKAGFTLLEILVATMLLIIIVLIMSGIFRQSTKAWDSGMAKTEMNMEGRAALNLMAMELSHAVADSYLDANIRDGGTEITFYTIGEPTSSPARRAVRRVRYSYDSGSQTLTRDVWFVSDYLPDGPSLSTSSSGTLLDNVSSLGFKTADGVIHTNDLPAWVEIRFTMSRESEYATIRVWSDGPDGVGSTTDDIKSWESQL